MWSVPRCTRRPDRGVPPLRDSFQLLPDHGRAGGAAKHEGRPGDRGDREGQGDQVEPGQGQAADETVIQSTGWRSAPAAALLAPSPRDAALLGGLSIVAALLDHPRGAALRDAFTGAARL